MSDMQNNNLPLDFQHPGGFVEETMRFINETAVSPQQIFALGAALSLGGILYGRQVQTESGQRTNLYVMSVGHTSCGKDHPLKMIARILDAGGATDLRLGQVTSDSAIEWALKRQPRQIALIDEAGHFFSAACDSRAKGSPAQSIKPALLELWSSAGGRWKGKQRVPRDGKEVAPVEIDMPHLCLYGTTQPQILFDSLSRNDLRDGWLARNLFFFSRTRPKPEVKAMREIPESIRREVERWKVPGPLVTIATSEEAQKVFSAFGDEIFDKMAQGDATGDETNYLYGKAGENATRIALILAVSRAGETARIEEADAVYATRLVAYLIDDVIRMVKISVCDSPDEKGKKQILKLVGERREAGMLKSEITKRTQFLRRSIRDEYLDDLVSSGELVQTTTMTSGGARYTLASYVC